ncbi:MAG: cytochrome b5-like heme/steroid binding domain-containing protein [Candidatus Pacebacteria bacterium]|nr:cytochrome b5-like heme/steroid binding domain-containing protein [Candidatus Paceibacterota bacterium]
MKNRTVAFWTIFMIIFGGVILFFSLSKNQISQNINTPTVVNNAVQMLYTLADVSKHSGETSCWTVIDGKIYDITSFISSHPAGVQKILQGCGIDATTLYGRVGAHDISKLTNFVVGTLK